MSVKDPPVLNNDSLNDTDREILELLREGRVTPPYVSDRLDKSREYASERLIRLNEHGHTVRPAPGLYELVDDPLGELEDETDERVAELEDEISRLREQLADARNGAGVDVDRVCASVETALRALDERQPSIDLAKSELETALEECGRDE